MYTVAVWYLRKKGIEAYYSNIFIFEKPTSTSLFLESVGSNMTDEWAIISE